MACYNIRHKVLTLYHPQINELVEVSNKKLKKILEKIVNSSSKDWLESLMMHFRHIERLTRHQLAYHLIDWCLRKHVTYLLSYSIRCIGLLKL